MLLFSSKLFKVEKLLYKFIKIIKILKFIKIIKINIKRIIRKIKRIKTKAENLKKIIVTKTKIRKNIIQS